MIDRINQPHEHNVHPAYRPDIDGLRAIAVIAVLLFHAFPSLLPGGFVGVDVFFVISGYLISTIIFRSLSADSFSFAEFYAKRVKRIFPALIIVLVTTYVLGWLTLFPDEFQRLGRQILAGALFAQNFQLWHEAGYFNSLSESMPLLHLWSLSVEEQFYLAFPLIAWACLRARLNQGLVTGLLWAGSLAMCLYLSDLEQYSVQAFYLPHTRAWEILTGALIAYCQVSYVRPLSQIPKALRSTFVVLAPAIGIALIVYAALMLDKHTPFPSWRAFLPVFGAGLLIASGHGSPVNRFILSWRPLVWVGLISYPLYLWHWPLLSFARILESGTPPVWLRAVALAISLGLAWATYLFAERPARAARAIPRLPVALAMVVACIGLMGAITEAMRGIEFRAAAADAAGNRFDYPYKHSCRPLMGTTFREDWCNADTLSAGMPETVMIGDSFANAASTIVRAFDEAEGMRNSDFAQFGRGECPMLHGYGPEYCQQVTAAAEKYIAETPSVHTVILASNWPAYYSEKDYHGLRPKQTHQEFMDAFTATVEHYQRLGKHVAVFLATPQDTNPRSCVARRFELRDWTPPPNCNYPIANALRGDSDYRLKIIPYLASRGVPVFDPFRIMCEAESCRVSVDRAVLYSDSGHISERGGRYLAQHGRQLLKSVLSNSKPPRLQADTGVDLRPTTAPAPRDATQ
ncbi:acyltransferase family protein [Ralstonia sp. 22111]|uniref:acyltransferase family protein n=1 Tax=Ralstonia sp. 22111 TaxID=3453878 RepID=UPI003F8572A2